MAETWFVSLIVSGPEEAGMAEEAVSADALSIIVREYDGGPKWELLLQFDHEPDRAGVVEALAALPGFGDYALSIEQDSGTDWVARYRRNAQPVRAGRFFVYPSHLEGDPPQDTIPIRMDAGLAFGTGDHATTTGCLRALDRLAADGYAPRRAIDLGCGTGILAIAMRKLWPDLPITASDIDPVAVETARENLARNGALDGVELVTCDGWPENDASDLCAANILAGPLIALAPKAAAGISPGGRAILSGILTTQADDVGSAWRKNGFSPRSRDDYGEWATLVFDRA